MKYIPFPMLALAVAIGGCGSIPASYPPLAEAETTYRTAADDPKVVQYAPLELEKAKRSLERAQAIQKEGDDDDIARLDHQAYLARQQARLAQQTATLRSAEQEIKEAGAERDKVLLAARTQEARAARESASEQAQAAALARSRQALADRQAQAAQARSAELASRVRALQSALEDAQVRQTDHGYVLTLGADVLFDVGEADLKPGAERSITTLADFLREDPARRIGIEGFTDSTGTETFNQALSERRAQAVKASLVARGIDPSRIETRGYGEAYPIATNATTAGRQLNRRVEIVVAEGAVPDMSRR